MQIPTHPYLPWEVQETEFPSAGTISEQAQFLLRYALLAASSHNTQPWEFLIQDNVIELYPDFTRALPNSDPCNRQLFISLGCALGNLVVAAEHFGFSVSITFPGNRVFAGPVVRIVLDNAQAYRWQGQLFPWITQRRMDRRPYQVEKLVEDAFLEDLILYAHDFQIVVTCVTEPPVRQQLLELVEQSTLGIHQPGVLREWSQWFRPLDTQEEDGLPPFDFIVPEEVIPVEVQARETRQLFATAPLFLVLSSAIDDEERWIRAGRMLTYCSLVAAKHGVAQAPWGAMIEHEETAAAISSLLSLPRPLYFARLGYPEETTLPHHTPRRSVERILLRKEELCTPLNA